VTSPIFEQVTKIHNSIIQILLFSFSYVSFVVVLLNSNYIRESRTSEKTNMQTVKQTFMHFCKEQDKFHAKKQTNMQTCNQQGDIGGRYPSYSFSLLLR